MWEKLRKDTGKKKEKCRGSKLGSHLLYMRRCSALSSSLSHFSDCSQLSDVTVSSELVSMTLNTVIPSFLLSVVFSFAFFIIMKIQ